MTALGLSLAWSYFCEWFSERPHTAAAICRGDPSVERYTRFVDGECVWWPEGEWEGVPKVLDPETWRLMATEIEYPSTSAHMKAYSAALDEWIEKTTRELEEESPSSVNISADVSKIIAQKVNIDRVFRAFAIEARDAGHPIDEERSIAQFRSIVESGKMNENELIAVLEKFSETKGDTWLALNDLAFVVEQMATWENIIAIESTGEFEKLRSDLIDRAIDRALVNGGKLISRDFNPPQPKQKKPDDLR